MAQERIHIVTHDHGWAVKWEGKTEVESVHATQKEALDAGRELAQRSEADLVVHRADGTFRKVYSVTGAEEGEEEMADRENNGRGDRRRRAVGTEDVVSVGSRISWGAVLAGACVSLALLVTFGVLAAAVGITARDRASSDALTYGGLIASIFVTLAALFVGGFVVSRITAGEDKTEALTYGVVLWGVLFVGAALLSGLGVNVGSQALTAGRATAPAIDEETLREWGLNEEQRKKATEDLAKRASDVNPTAAAWLTFLGIVLSIGAAVGGSVTGAGPTLVLRAFRDRRTAVTPERARVQPEPANR